MSVRVLIVDDESDLRWVLLTLLRQEGFTPSEADCGKTALRLLQRTPVDALIVDLKMPDMNGLDVVRSAKHLYPQLPIIVLTGFGTIATAVEAVKAGAFHFLTKPFENSELLRTLRAALPTPAERSDHDRPLSEVMGPSLAIAKVIAAVLRVAPTDYTVIVQGETGTGKEVVARAIHRHSKRAAGPFVPIDCGAIAPQLIESELFGHEKGAFTSADRAHTGCFELAQGGTLFLDEIGNLPIGLQSKLLRVLQERQVRRLGSTTTLPVDVRVVVATNHDLATADAQAFRPDLFHRLNEFMLRLPALRERVDDIPHLARRFVVAACRELGRPALELAPTALDRLRTQSWPGNVRELANVVRRAALLAEEQIAPEHLGLAEPVNEPLSLPLTPALDGQLGLKELLRQRIEETEREILAQALRQTNGNKAQAARLLRVDYKTVRTKAKEYGIRIVEDDDGQE
jgi:two-component system nitrogen regulation response regulator GlnG